MTHERDRSLTGRMMRLAAEGVTILLTLCIVAGVVLYARLHQGPLDLSRWRPEIAGALHRAVPGLSVDFATAELALGPDLRLRLRVRDATLLHDGAPLVRAPAIAAGFGLRGVLTGDLNPKDVVVEGVTARLVRDENAIFSFAFGDEGETDEAAGAALFAEMLSASASGDAPAAGGPERLTLRDASILYIDRMSRRAWRAHGVDIGFTNGARGVGADLGATLSGGEFGDLAISARGHRAADGLVYMRFRFENAAPGDIADQLPALDWLAAFNAPVAGDMRVTINSAGDLVQLGGTLEAGTGTVALGGGATEPLDSAALAFEFEPDTDRFLIERATLRSPRASAEGAGFVEIGRDAAGAARDVVAQLDLADIALDAPEAFYQPLAYDTARVTGRVTLDPLTIEIGELRLGAGAMHVAAAGRVDFAGDDIRADLSLTGAGMTVRDLIDHWPKAAEPGARDWMLPNMESGDITDLDATLRLGGDGDALNVDFTFVNAAGHYLRPMPPIVDGVGAGQLDLKRFALKLDSGRVELEGGGALDIAGSSFVIPDLDHPDTPADIELKVTGALADALAIVDHEPLGFVSRLGLPLEQPQGEVDVVTRVTIPLLKNLLLEDVFAQAEATIRGLSVNSAALGGAVKAQEVKMEVDTTRMSLSGAAAFKGLRGRVDWREDFASGRRDIRLRSALTPGMLADYGVAVPWFEAGVADVDARVALGRTRTEVVAKANLDAAALRVDQIGWTKAAGEAASLSADIMFDGDRIEARGYALDAPGLTVKGDALLSAGGELRRVAIGEFRYRGGADLTGEAERRDGRWNVAVRGPLLDLTRFPDLIEGGDAGRAAALDLSLDIDRVQLRPSVHLAPATGRFSIGEDRSVTGALEGQVAGEAAFRIDVDSGPEGGEVVATTENAGALLRAAKIFDDGSGGVLRIEAQIAGTEALRFSGRARLNDIVIHEDAKLERLLAGAELTELHEKMRKDGMSFNRIRAGFSYADGVLSSAKTVAVGPAIGLTIKGDYALEEDRLDVNGVFTPVYTINAALGKIPLLGKLLTGGDGQGLFAFTFSADGPVENPEITVNPLSVLAPGPFRALFSMDGDPTATDDWIRQRMQADR